MTIQREKNQRVSNKEKNEKKSGENKGLKDENVKKYLAVLNFISLLPFWSLKMGEAPQILFFWNLPQTLRKKIYKKTLQY